LVRSRHAWEETDESQNVLVGEVTKILDNIQLLNTQLRKARTLTKAVIAWPVATVGGHSSPIQYTTLT
jgi:hypothetical protein